MSLSDAFLNELEPLPCVCQDRCTLEKKCMQLTDRLYDDGLLNTAQKEQLEEMAAEKMNYVLNRIVGRDNPGDPVTDEDFKVIKKEAGDWYRKHVSPYLPSSDCSFPGNGL